MASIGESQEERILAAVNGLVIARVQARLPIEKRGIRAIDPIRERVPGAVSAALETVVSEVFAEVEKLIDPAEPFAPDEDGP